MTQRMALARAAFEARAGDHVKVHGATYTWDSLPSGRAELAFLLSIGDAPPRLHLVTLPPASDVVQAASALGATLGRRDLVKTPAAPDG